MKRQVNILRMLGRHEDARALENGRCPKCHEKVYMSDFRDQLSRDEYKISFLCQTCQDKVFA